GRVAAVRPVALPPPAGPRARGRAAPLPSGDDRSGPRRRLPARLLRPRRRDRRRRVLRRPPARHAHRRPGDRRRRRAVRRAGPARRRARPDVLVDLALPAAPAPPGRAGHERRGAGGEPGAGRPRRAGPQHRPRPALRRYELRRRHLLRVRRLPRRPGAGVPGGRAGTAAGRAVRRHLLRPVLPDQGDPRLARHRRRGPPADRQRLLRAVRRLRPGVRPAPHPARRGRPALRRLGGAHL
ncbi:MAG: hypothetical protein AVDCRST_MAG66-1497, partial [uncultured Pseudonocardia sp.]